MEKIETCYKVLDVGTKFQQAKFELSRKKWYSDIIQRCVSPVPTDMTEYRNKCADQLSFIKYIYEVGIHLGAGEKGMNKTRALHQKLMGNTDRII